MSRPCFPYCEHLQAFLHGPKYRSTGENGNSLKLPRRGIAHHALVSLIRYISPAMRYVLTAATESHKQQPPLLQDGLLSEDREIKSHFTHEYLFIRMAQVVSSCNPNPSLQYTFTAILRPNDAKLYQHASWRKHANILTGRS